MIEFVDVATSRNGRPVLRGVSLTVAKDEVVALVGRSGSGKTTLLRLVNAMLRFDAGDVLVGERSVTDWDPIALRRQTGYVIQDVGLLPHLSVADNVATVPRLLGWDEPRVSERIRELLHAVGLPPDEYAARWPDQLSGGQRQRVGLARALAANPAVLLMDEPFGALDPVTRAELHVEFKRLQSNGPRAVLLVTHDLSEAFALAQRVAVLHDGEVVACESPAALLESADPRVRVLVDTRFG